MKRTMKREALEKMNRLAHKMTVGEAKPAPEAGSFWYRLALNAREWILELGELL
jgi:hypothetical protein